jgi:ribosomal protein S18 acetylase RimI-like enzyme
MGPLARGRDPRVRRRQDAAGAWPDVEALERSATAFRQLAPDGRATAGHELRSVVDDAGTVVGSVWLAPRDAIGTGSAFIFDIEIAAAHRGRGHGRAALLALEPPARDLGDDAIGLHVFADNEVARSLYRSTGYEETDVTMRKDLY